MIALPCPPALWAEFAGLLDRALELPPAARRAWLDGAVAPRAAVRPYLERALASAAALDNAAYERGPALRGDDAPQLAAGALVGPYRLLRELGRGGMAEVWLAERADGAFHRHVALKLPHAHLLAGALRQRFTRERDFLAGLAHPHIAQFHDAGVSDTGVPYLAMEWIEGEPITRHCARLGLGVAPRLRMFIQVLEAVGHAHERFIAHRDIKPSNILVDAHGGAKLLDFGIAKLLAGDGADATELTRQAGCAATPDYAAPEQVGGSAITTAVDVYALGAVLLRLLAGCRPSELAGGPASARVDPRHAATVGGLGAARLARALRGDLDAVVAKALQTDPARRYRSAGAFADELRAWLSNRPVRARRMGRARRAWELVRRHKLTSALVAALVVVLAAGASGIAWEAREARTEALRAERAAAAARAQAQRAEQEARRERATRDFLVGIFEFSDPRRRASQPRDATTARELLDIGARRIELGPPLDADTRLSILALLADIYDELDEPARFDAALDARTQLALARHGELHPVTLDARLRRIQNLDDRGDHAGALAALAQLDAAITRAGLDADAVRAYWWLLRGRALTPDAARQAERVAAYERAIALYERFAPQDGRYAIALNNLATSWHALGDEARSAVFERRAIAAAQAAGNDGGLAIAWANLGKYLGAQGDYDGAERADAQAEALALATYGRDTWVWWHAAATHAQALHQRGDREGARAAWAALFAVVPAPGAPLHNAQEDYIAANVREVHGACLLAEGRPAAALAELRAAEAGYGRAPQHQDERWRVRGEIGRAQADLGRWAEARTAIAGALDDFAAAFPPDNPRVLEQRVAWGRFLSERLEDDAARAQFALVVEQARGRRLESAALAQAGLAELAARRGDAGEAMARSAAALDTFAHVTGARDVRTAPRLELARADALRLGGDAAGARTFAQRALDELRRYDAPDSAAVAQAAADVHRR